MVDPAHGQHLPRPLVAKVGIGLVVAVDPPAGSAGKAAPASPEGEGGAPVRPP